jgi:hypothetical protein
MAAYQEWDAHTLAQLITGKRSDTDIHYTSCARSSFRIDLCFFSFSRLDPSLLFSSLIVLSLSSAGVSDISQSHSLNGIFSIEYSVEVCK